jgi:hypothetical protein
MSAPIQMTSQTLNAIKGWPQQSAVDFVAKFDSTIVNRVPPGSVVHLSSSKTFLLGVGNVNCMPMFTFQASDDPDVANDGGNVATTAGAWQAISPVGNVMALVAVGAYELISTNYDTTVSYNPNDLLTSPTSGANAGMLTKGVSHTNVICGIVSRGVTDNGYGTNALAFWPIVGLI